MIDAKEPVYVSLRAKFIANQRNAALPKCSQPTLFGEEVFYTLRNGRSIFRRYAISGFVLQAPFGHAPYVGGHDRNSSAERLNADDA